ncbi:hypothetical protein [Bacillus nakamurai]|nr:hypothetical protein [Bacillus nakamurai]
MSFIASVNWELVQFVSVSMVNEYAAHHFASIRRYSFPRCFE